MMIMYLNLEALGSIKINMDDDDVAGACLEGLIIASKKSKRFN